MKIVPMGIRLYLVLDAVAEKRVGASLEGDKKLWVPDTHSELTRTGTVQAVGDGVTMYKPGDRVLVTYNVGRAINPVTDTFTPANDIHRICTEEEILAKIEE